MERSFKKEVQALKLGEGETFRGEGILAVTKALLQSGVSYVGGYQGAPVSHLLDVLVDAAAILGASINYPLRGAVTWKSIVGTNVAADALSNLASPGVVGGVMIILGEDYGEGASVIQERSYAYAMKSSMWLMDPRPDLPTIVRMVEEGFELSEASHAPVMMELRIRACHVTGEFKTKPNRRAAIHPRTQAQRGDRGRSHRRRHHRARRPHQRRAARAGAARSRRSLRRKPHSALRAQRRVSAGTGGAARVLRRKARRAGGRGRQSRLHRAGGQRGAAPRRYRDARARQGDAAARRRIHLRGAAQRACVVPGRGAARGHRRRRDRRARERDARAQGRRYGGG